jgi:hypothetical protein
VFLFILGSVAGVDDEDFLPVLLGDLLRPDQAAALLGEVQVA